MDPSSPWIPAPASAGLGADDSGALSAPQGALGRPPRTLTTPPRTLSVPPGAAAPPAPYATWPSPDDAGAPTTADAPRSNRSKIRKKLTAIGAAIIALLTKLKTILVLLPKVKLLAASSSMLVSVAAYALLFGWPFAVGIVLLIFVHEMGHVIALRREGIKASPPMFIPFLGAVISARSLGDNAAAEARVGLAGPILGAVGTVLALVIWHLTGSDYWRALAYFGFFINLFNLIPMSPFDGGRAMAAMAPWMWLIGFVVMGVLAIELSNPFVLIFLVIGGLDSWRRWKQRRAHAPETDAYYRVTPRQRLGTAAVYIVLAALLVLGMHATYVYRGL
jgi:Zn-dependent protease